MKPVDLLPRYFDPQPKPIPRLSLIQRVGRILGKKESRRSCSTPVLETREGFIGGPAVITLDADEWDQFMEVTTTPQKPSPSIIAAAQMIRDLYRERKKDVRD